ncbi:MAG: zinc ABC transporter substrate-binding protein [endosymbiont of Galathealinum brachiosum]|uniref:Zinc ABC transporter substrate-binding protein n=1 Tax=endosymbiont of Galathealinum brachiosum TaxID=2200906 RepID=A0A370DIX7_9GAMM|nr:MAG: zinc ABC transporter substrate-binding protein [endosymbiont of Galathealinum brachiosum]
MKTCIRSLSIVVMLFISTSLMAEINVFACEPEWASLVDELGGERLSSYAATTAYQDPHHIEARPGLISKIRKADLVVCSGADLEAGWLPILLRQVSNQRLMPGKIGHFEAAKMVERLDVPIDTDRSMGDVHEAGNPHVHLDPRRIQIIAKALMVRLKQVDPQGAEYYQLRFDDFTQRWQQAILQWKQQASALQGKRIVVHHRDWVYLFDWLGIEIAGALEPKPGLPATPGHLVLLKQLVTAKPVDMIVHTPYQSTKAAKRLSQITNTPVVELPYTVGGADQVNDLFDLFSITIEKLKSGLL